ncbi:TIGR03826 family flagellar region protein [Paenibacillus glycanilyticus]|uniref:TIGR03826 family flagellar region protein n=1 Tax=Paenibacillus glycanilyticus TaxID=126569 RepID=UPI003EB8D779
MNVENCPRCGKIFAKNFRDVCPACIREIDKEYELCSTYLREQKGAVITELHEATGVSIKQITKFIKEGRISLLNAPNLMYPCEVCGTLIRENNICGNCRARLIKDTQHMYEDEARNAALRADERVSYKGIDKYKNRQN